MLPDPICLVLATMLCACVHGLQREDPSAFLDQAQYAAITSTSTELVCDYSTYSRSGIAQHRMSFPMHEVTANLTKYAYELSSPDRLQQTVVAKSRVSLVIGTEFHYPDDMIAVVNHKASMDSFLTLNLWPPASPQSILCLEVLLHKGVIDVFLPTFPETEEMLARKHSVDLLTAHFGVPFIMPPPELVKTFTDKSSFSSWMAGAGLIEFTPTVFKSKSEVTFPCLVKGTSNVWGRGIYLTNNEAELNRAIAQESGPYILQVGGR